MHTPGDIHRSLRRYVAWVLGARSDPAPPVVTDWRVHLAQEELPDDRRPTAVVEPSTPVTGRGLATAAHGSHIDESRTYAISCYPALGDTAKESLAIAEGVVGLLRDAFAIGIDGSAPERIPLYDYAGVGLEESGPAEPYDYLWVEDYPVRSIRDPLDPRRYSVVCDLRVSWRRAGRVPPPVPTVADMPGTFRP